MIAPLVVVLLVVAVIFLVIAFTTLAHECERIRHVLYSQGRTIDSLNHVDTIQSRQLDIQRARINDLMPPIVNLSAEPSMPPPYRPTDQIKGEQSGAEPAEQDHPFRDECNHSVAIPSAIPSAIPRELRGIAPELHAQPPDPRRGERTNGDGQVG